MAAPAPCACVLPYPRAGRPYGCFSMDVQSSYVECRMNIDLCLFLLS